jgi:hypothetical protein
MSRSSLPWLVVGPPFGAQVAPALAQSSPEKQGALGIGIGGYQDPRWASSAVAKAHAFGQRLNAGYRRRQVTQHVPAWHERTSRHASPRPTFAIAADLAERASFPLSPEGDSLQGGFLWKSSR